MYDNIKHPKSIGQSKEYHTHIICAMKNGLATFQHNSIYVVDRCTVFFILDQNYYILFLFHKQITDVKIPLKCILARCYDWHPVNRCSTNVDWFNVFAEKDRHTKAKKLPTIILL